MRYASTTVAELKDDQVRSYSVSPADFDMAQTDLAALKVSSALESLMLIRSVLDNEAGPARDIVALNAGAAIYSSGLAPDLASGVAAASLAIENGSARTAFDGLVEMSNSF